jgi:hypothetical protein
VLIVAAWRYPQIVGVLQRRPTPRPKVCNTAGDIGDARIVIRGLLVVAPAALLVACGVPAVQSGYAGVPSRKEAVVATAVAPSPTPGVDDVAPPPAAVGQHVPGAAVARAPRPTNAAQEGCTRNYTPCVPDDPVDVDCAGGSGNGPSYVTGPVRVIGKDVYGLDADHNGVGCEAGAAVSSAPAPRQAPPEPEGPASQPTSRPKPRPTAEPRSTRPATTLTPTTRAAATSEAAASSPLS